MASSQPHPGWRDACGKFLGPDYHRSMTMDRNYLRMALVRDDVAIVMSAELADLEAHTNRTTRHLWLNGQWYDAELPQITVAVGAAVVGGKAHLYYLDPDGILLEYSAKTYTATSVTQADDPDADRPSARVPL